MAEIKALFYDKDERTLKAVDLSAAYPVVQPTSPNVGDIYFNTMESAYYIHHGVPPTWQKLSLAIKICACTCPEPAHLPPNRRGRTDDGLPVYAKPCNQCTKCVDFAEDNLEWLLRRDAISKGTIC